MTFATRVRIQMQLFVVLLYDLAYNLLPFWTLKNAFLRATGSRIGRKAYIHTRARFTRPGNLVLGDHSVVNFGCYLDTRGGITIGDNVMVGHCSKIYTAGHDIDDPAFTGFKKPVAIERNAVIFPNTLIMPGVTIGEGAVVLTGSVVVKSVEAFDVVGGNPAKFIRKRAADIDFVHDYGWWFANV